MDVRCGGGGRRRIDVTYFEYTRWMETAGRETRECVKQSRRFVHDSNRQLRLGWPATGLICHMYCCFLFFLRIHTGLLYTVVRASTHNATATHRKLCASVREHNRC